MSKAIGIKVKKASGDYDPGVSKFFGSPTIPQEWEDNWHEDALFLCQIRLSDIAALDTDNRLPHTGYLYFFLDTESYPYSPLMYYYNGEPNMVYDNFNEAVSDPRFQSLTEEWLMEFEPVNEEADGIKLLGVPADWNYAEPAPKLLMQFDPLGSQMGFLDDIDGFIYFFFGDDESDFDSVNLWVERS